MNLKTFKRIIDLENVYGYTAHDNVKGSRDASNNQSSPHLNQRTTSSDGNQTSQGTIASGTDIVLLLPLDESLEEECAQRTRCGGENRVDRRT